MPSSRDPGGSVHVPAHVTFLGQMRGTGVQADPHPDRPRGEQGGERLRRRERSRSGREGEEEGVALRVDLEAALGGAGRADHAAVLGERLGVPRGTELMKQPCRALHVREQKGDGARRELAPHRPESCDGARQRSTDYACWGVRAPLGRPATRPHRDDGRDGGG